MCGGKSNAQCSPEQKTCNDFIAQIKTMATGRLEKIGYLIETELILRDEKQLNKLEILS